MTPLILRRDVKTTAIKRCLCLKVSFIQISNHFKVTLPKCFRGLVAFEPVGSLYQGRTVNSLSKKDTVGTGTNCPAYEEFRYSKMTGKQRTGTNIS